VSREEFDQIVKNSIRETIKVIGDDYFDLFLALIQKKSGVGSLDSATVQEVEVALEPVFGRLAIAVKHVIVLRICATLGHAPPILTKNMEWMIQEIRTSYW
jgi:hypothetical protein